MKNYYMLFLLLICFACQDEVKMNMKPVSGFKNSKNVIEEGQSIMFECLSFDKDGDIVRRLWDFGNGKVSEDKEQEVIYETEGEYKVMLTVWDNKGEQNPIEFSKTIIVKEKSLSDVQPDIIWEFITPAGFQDVVPAVDNKGNIIIGCDGKTGRPGGAENILVIDNKGKLKWKFASGDVVRSSAAVSNDDVIYIGSYDKKLYAFNAEDNTPLGSFALGTTAKYCSPAIDNDGTVYISCNKKLYCVGSLPAMAKVWEFDCEGVTQSTPVIDENTIYVPSNSGFLYAVNKDGSLKWKTQFGTTCTAVPAIGEDGTIYMCGETSTGGVVMALNSETGDIKWKKDFGCDFNYSGIAMNNNNLFVGNANCELAALSLETGETSWIFKTQGKIIGVPAIDNHGNIYIGDDKGVFYVLNDKGKMRYKELKLGAKIWSSPVIAHDGTIYICADQVTSSDPGKLYALKTIAESPFESWAMRGNNQGRTGRK